jgi:superfamily I DNA/RNA helicase
MKNPAVTATCLARTCQAIEAFVQFVEQTRAKLDCKTDAGSVYNSVQSESGDSRDGCPSLQLWADHFLDEIGYWAELRRGEKDREAAENRVRNLKDFIATMDARRSAAVSLLDGLHLFLEEVSLNTEREEEEETKGDAVTLITMHSCKGLEFPRVYIVGMEDGLLPHSRSKSEGTLDEERRLFYVAVTRAMHTLFISHCAGRRKYGQVMPCHPSPFLKELPVRRFFQHRPQGVD